MPDYLVLAKNGASLKFLDIVPDTRNPSTVVSAPNQNLPGLAYMSSAYKEADLLVIPMASINSYKEGNF